MPITTAYECDPYAAGGRVMVRNRAMMVKNLAKSFPAKNIRKIRQHLLVARIGADLE